ncbi:MAG: hypothetical protein AB7O37_09100 [Vicinamibacteria bacterium]
MADRSRLAALVLLASVALALLLVPAGVAAPFGALIGTSLLFWVPGAAVWLALRPRQAGLVQWLLLPSLLGMLPAAGAAMAVMRMGLSPGAAVATTLGVSTGVLLVSRQRLPRWANGDGPLVAAAALVAALLVAVPLAANGLRADAWDAPLHASLATRVLAGHVPPDSPLVADQPIHYYWLYHLLAAGVAEWTGVGLTVAFGLLDVHAFFLFLLAGACLTQRSTQRAESRAVGMLLLLVGMNGLGWLFFALRAGATADSWEALLVPFRMAPGPLAQLAGVLHLFLDGNPFPLSFAFALVFLARAMAIVEGSSEREPFLVAALTLAGALHLHLLLGVLLGAVAVMAALAARGPRRAAALAAAVGLAALITTPYALCVMLGRPSGAPLVSFSSAGLVPGLLEELACLGPLALLALPALRDPQWLAQARQRFLLGCALIPMAAYPVTLVAGGAQYKLLYLALFPLAPIAAAARTASGRRLRSAAVALFLPSCVITSLAFSWRPPDASVEAGRARLLEWIRAATPVESIFVEEPFWEREGRSTAQVVRDDRRYFDIVIHARRRMLVGYDPVVLGAQWGHSGVQRRQRLAALLLAGEPLNLEQLRYLDALSGAVFVVVHSPQPDTEAFAASRYRLVHAAPDARVYRLENP